MNFSESYIIYLNGEQYGAPFSSEKSLNACIAILKHFDPAAMIIVEVFRTVFDRTYIA